MRIHAQNRHRLLALLPALLACAAGLGLALPAAAASSVTRNLYYYDWMNPGVDVGDVTWSCDDQGNFTVEYVGTSEYDCKNAWDYWQVTDVDNSSGATTAVNYADHVAGIGVTPVTRTEPLLRDTTFQWLSFSCSIDDQWNGSVNLDAGDQTALMTCTVPEGGSAPPAESSALMIFAIVLVVAVIVGGYLVAFVL